MRQFFSRLWNAELTQVSPRTLRWLWMPALLVIVAYPIGELLLFPPNPDFVTVSELQAHSRSGEIITQTGLWVWIALVSFVILFRMFFLLYGTLFSATKEDRDQFYKQFVIFNPAAMMGILLKVMLSVSVGLVFLLMGWDFFSGVEAISRAGEELTTWIGSHIPTLIELPGWGWALLAGWTLYGFTGWFIHWLTHTFRFLWHVVHAPHHLPEYLHPVASPVANTFDIFILVPSVIAHGALTKLFHHEALFLESGMVILCMYALEVFNHSTVHYQMAFRNPLIRFFSNFFGGMGVYHYTHHSSAMQHQKANLGGGLFQMWDRIFGTFAHPPETIPAIGFTGNPPFHRNPFRIVFGGLAKILYELWMNPGLKTKFLILFGGIHYQPPIVGEFVKKKIPAATEVIAGT